MSSIRKASVLTSKQSWFVPYAEELHQRLQKLGYDAGLYFAPEEIEEPQDVLFILSYFRIIKEDQLKRHKHSLVIHASDLPKGKGWSPFFWQILEGKMDIPIVLFEATAAVDAGDIYLKDHIHQTGTELHDELRHMLAQKQIDMCEKFLAEYPIQPVPQQGEESFYSRRGPAHSELDVNKTIAEQFDNLRIASNTDYPAFFQFRGRKYVLNIFHGEEDDK